MHNNINTGNMIKNYSKFKYPLFIVRDRLNIIRKINFTKKNKK